MTQAFVDQHEMENDAEEVPEPLTAEDFIEIGVIQIGKNRGVSVSNFQGWTNICIREYHRRDGKISHSRRGINLIPSQWTELKRHIENIDLRISHCLEKLEASNPKQGRQSSKPGLKRLQKPKNNSRPTSILKSNILMEALHGINPPQVSSYEPSVVYHDSQYMHDSAAPMLRQNAMYHKHDLPQAVSEVRFEARQHMDNQQTNNCA